MSATEPWFLDVVWVGMTFVIKGKKLKFLGPQWLTYYVKEQSLSVYKFFSLKKTLRHSVDS